MHVCKYKKRRFRYNPNKPKVMRFGVDRQPHAKKCMCVACQAYIRIIAVKNPDRLSPIENKDNAGLIPEESAIPLYLLRKRTELEKLRADERYKRETLGKSSPKWRG